MKIHTYKTQIAWTGNKGFGTSGYNKYDRSYTISVKGKPAIIGSADPAFLGDISRHNPEELLLASISSCHMLWYLHLCSSSGITVVSYEDNAVGSMDEDPDGSGRFTSVILTPTIVIEESDKKDLAINLHSQANKMCFIANSLNFKVLHRPNVIVN